MLNKEENKNNLIKIIIYTSIFIIAIIILKFTNTNLKKQNTTTKKEKNKIIEKIKSINSDFYTEKIHLIMDDDAITLEFEKNKEIYIGIKKYHKQEINYIKHEDNYYTLENDSIKKLNDFKDFEYDTTFINLQNLKDLLNIKKTENLYKSENLEILKLTYNINDITEFYNKYNNTNITKQEDGLLTIEIYYNDNELKQIIIDATEFHNFINDSHLENVTYKIELKNKKEEDISWLLEKLN